MALQIPSFADPRDPARPLTNAYAWISGLTVDLALNSGSFALTVNPNEAAWQATPIARIGVGLGQEGIPTLADLMADAEFSTAFNTIGAKLYAAAAAHVPDLAGATPA